MIFNLIECSSFIKVTEREEVLSRNVEENIQEKRRLMKNENIYKQNIGVGREDMVTEEWFLT